MKYSIEGFLQSKLVELGLNANDALILRWYIDKQPLLLFMFFEAISYSIVDFQDVLNDLPILESNINEVKAIFNKLVSKDILSEYKNTRKGIIILTISNNYYSLIEGQ